MILTTAFPHPADLPPRSRDDPNFYQRWLDDGRAQPLYTNVKGNMVWKGSDGRPLNIEEAEELMGYPAAYTASLQPRATESANMARRHAVGNGFHIPSVALLLSLLVLPHRTAATPWGAGMAVSPEASRDGLAYGPCAPQCAHQGDSGRLATDAVHGPGRIPPSSRAPRFADQVAREALGLFPESFWERAGAPDGMVQRMLVSTSSIDLAPLDDFLDYLQQTGAPATATGLDVQALWSKSPMHAAAAKQHRLSTAQIDDGLVQPGGGPAAHASEARRVEHPFARDPPLERDLRFVVQMYAKLGLQVGKHRKRMLASQRR